jgi:RecA-family ATPase
MLDIAANAAERKARQLSQDIDRLLQRARGADPEESHRAEPLPEACREFAERNPDGIVEFYEVPREDDPDDRAAALLELAEYLPDGHDFARLLAHEGLRFPAPQELAASWKPDALWEMRKANREANCITKMMQRGDNVVSFLEARKQRQEQPDSPPLTQEEWNKAWREEQAEREEQGERRPIPYWCRGLHGFIEEFPQLILHHPELLQQVAMPAAKVEAVMLQQHDWKGAKTIITMNFQPIKYVVPDIIVEGLTLLAGKPKVGKSWMLLDMAIAVTKGGFTLGHKMIGTIAASGERTPLNGIKCEEGDALYCALEDNERRLQSRLIKLLDGKPTPQRLDFITEMPRLAKGGLELIRRWIASKSHPRLVIIDTLAMVKEPAKRNQTAYEADYASVVELRKLSAEHGLAVIIVHHLRKAEADDAFDTVSGTLGLTGAPDSILVLKRDNSGNIVLHGKGRDLMEIEKAMSFDADYCAWCIEGEAADVKRSDERGRILSAVADADEPIGANDIATEISMKPSNVRFLLHKLRKEGAIERASYGKYQMPTTADEKRFRVIKSCGPETVCLQCQKADGKVMRIKDTAKPGSESETLHEGCAREWFDGDTGA